MQTAEQLKESKAKLNAELDEKISVASKYQNELARFQRAVEECEDALLSAETRRSYAAKRIEELRSLSLNWWPLPDLDAAGAPRVSAFHALVESHTGILALEALLKDFPRAKQHLLAKLKEAQDALGEFQRTRSKI